MYIALQLYQHLLKILTIILVIIDNVPKLIKRCHVQLNTKFIYENYSNTGNRLEFNYSPKTRNILPCCIAVYWNV